MTNYEEIKDRYADELKDVVTYVNLSKKADNETEKQLLKDIAKEEHEHARILKHILEKAGELPTDPSVHESEEVAEKALNEV